MQVQSILIFSSAALSGGVSLVATAQTATETPTVIINGVGHNQDFGEIIETIAIHDDARPVQANGADPTFQPVAGYYNATAYLGEEEHPNKCNSYGSIAWYSSHLIAPSNLRQYGTTYVSTTFDEETVGSECTVDNTGKSHCPPRTTHIRYVTGFQLTSTSSTRWTSDTSFIRETSDYVTCPDNRPYGDGGFSICADVFTPSIGTPCYLNYRSRAEYHLADTPEDLVVIVP